MFEQQAESIFTVERRAVDASGIRLSVCSNGAEVGHGYIYVLRNDLHERPFAFFENLFIEPDRRRGGAGETLVSHALDLARDLGCYKIIGTVKREHRYSLQWFKRFGFETKAVEVRIDFP